MQGLEPRPPSPIPLVHFFFDPYRISVRVFFLLGCVGVRYLQVLWHMYGTYNRTEQALDAAAPTLSEVMCLFCMNSADRSASFTWVIFLTLQRPVD